MNPNTPSYYKFHNYDVYDIANYFNLSFCCGNALKYIIRAGVKTDDRLEDLQKAYISLGCEVAKLKESQDRGVINGKH